MIECQLKVCISNINFRYDTNMEVYLTSMLDIPMLSGIRLRPPLKELIIIKNK